MKLEQWLAQMKSADSSDRVDAADMLPEADISPEIVDALLAALEDGDALVRACAADTVGDLDAELVRTKILERIGVEKDDLARAYLLSSLGAMEHVEDIGLLVDHLKTSNVPIVRLQATHGLVMLSVRWAVKAMVNSADSSDRDEQTKAFSVMAVVADVFDEALDDIIKSAEDHRGAAESGAISGLARSGIADILKRRNRAKEGPSNRD